MILTDEEYDHWLLEYRSGRVWLPGVPRAPAPPTIRLVPTMRTKAPPPAHQTRKRRGEGYEPAKRRLAWMLADLCAYCCNPADTWDHITPRKHGGDHSESNLARVCHSCNHEKTTRKLVVFLAIRAQRKASGTWRRLPGLKLSNRNG